ncbi:DHA2 family efflux MFS transporter permease subunit [Streptomyces sp. NPDC057257]|uniref:DHA2 family efflux MFS transporter permease subunit n=1 Tax=Streptomyces sp. NPDC057257 TaxID=3346071 RepID=UPI003625D8B2
MIEQSRVATPATRAEPTAAHNPRAVLTVLSLAAFMASLDTFVVNVAFDAIGTSFSGSSIANLSWVLNGYAIVFAALLVPLGRLADRIGRKRMFLQGLGLFTAASVACAVAPGLWWLVVFRLLQAAGAAAITPTSLGLLLAAVPAGKRLGYVRIWTTVAGIAAAGGPVIGGLLVTASWRWVFLINLPVGIVAFVAARRVVPDSRDTAVTRIPDGLGAGLLTVGVGALALAIVKGGDWGWGSEDTIAVFVLAVAALAGFVWRAEHHPVPVVDPALYRVRTFAAANLAMLAFSLGLAGYLLMVVLWLQNVWHWSTIATGFGVAPGPAMVPLVAVLTQRLAHRVQAGALAAVGSVLFAVAAVVNLLLLGPHGTRYASELLPGQLIAGLGIGLTLPTLLAAATAGLPPHRASTGSGVINMTRQIGFVLGVSIVVAILGAPASYAAAHHAFQHGWWTIAAAELVAAVSCLGLLRRRASTD